MAARIDLSLVRRARRVRLAGADAGRLPDAEMLRTFNCGIGMVIVVAKARGGRRASALQEAGEAPVVIGEIVPPGGARTEAKGKGDTWAVQYAGALRYA